jgi:hypothetical protein
LVIFFQESTGARRDIRGDLMRLVDRGIVSQLHDRSCTQGRRLVIPYLVMSADDSLPDDIEN